MFKNWRTTLSGLISGGAVGFAGYTTGNPELMIAGAGMIVAGFASKDSNVVGAGDSAQVVKRIRKPRTVKNEKE